MANTYGYTTEDMRTAGNTLKSSMAEIQTHIDAAITAVNNLIGTGFATAVASGAYSTQFTELSTGLKQVNDNMGPLGDFLINYAQSVEDMDSQMGAALNGS